MSVSYRLKLHFSLNRLRYLLSIPLNSFRIYSYSAAHASFSKTYHILGHDSILNKFKRIKIIFFILYDSVINKRNCRNYKNNQRQNNIHSNGPWITKEIKHCIKPAVTLHTYYPRSQCWWIRSSGSSLALQQAQGQLVTLSKTKKENLTTHMKTYKPQVF